MEVSMTERFLSLANEYEKRAAGIRARVPNASPQSQRIMQSEAAAYERVCRALREQVSRVLEDDPS
jgi:hypothetical protein